MADFHSLALSLTPGLGGTLCRRLASLARPADLFAMSRPQLAALLGPSHPAVAAILGRNGLARAESELRICEQHHIKPLFFTDPDFPRRLNTADTADCPALLYTLGDADLNAERTVAVVGTRRATPAGKANTETLVGGLSHLSSPVVSGLAYGIDTAAHTAALAAGLPTVAVLGHGLDRIYPPANRNLAAQIIAAGGALVTEYPFGTPINPRQFPARNRIIAALADATVVVEAAAKGGALITATLAAGYHRQVFAFPGRLSDPYSEGTNALIATHKALLVRHADDLAAALNWPLSQPVATQALLFPQLTEPQERLRQLIATHQPMSLDLLTQQSNMPSHQLATLLFELESENIIRSLPGHLFELV